MENKFAILIVDDNTDMASTLQDILEAEGYSTAVAHDGQTVLTLHDKSVFDLALIDIRLPDMSGADLIKNLAERFSGVEYIIITGYASLDNAIYAVSQRHIVGYLTKPLDMGHLLALIKQVFKRKQAEDALRESEERYHNLLDNANDLIQFVGTDARIRFVNKKWLETLEYSEEEVKNLKMTDILHKNQIARVMEQLKRVANGETVKNLETTFISKHGKEINVEGNGSGLLQNDEFVGAIGIFRDVTDRKQAETKARELNVLKEVDRLRSELLANISHELRTPLASIKGFTSTLLRTDTKWSDEEQLDFLQTIDQETDRLTRLISDILDISRIDAGVLKLTRNKYTVSEILDLIGSTLASITKNHKLELIVPSELPPVLVDEVRIGQVFTNLVENATKFSSTGSTIIIEAQLSGDKIIASVKDRGDGIPPELLDRLFDRFYQTTNIATGRKSGGTGLGLSICQGIIEAHGGKIWVESKVAEGSKFSFSLPIL